MAKQFISIPADDIREFQDAKQAMARIEDIYNHSVETNYRAFKAFAAGEAAPAPVPAFYPYVFTVLESEIKGLDLRLSWSFARGASPLPPTLSY